MTNDDISIEQLWQTALGLLARREHGRVELRRKLMRKFGSLSEIEVVLDKLEESGYLNDQRFADSVARTRSSRGYGPMRVKAELAAKGVRQETAVQAMDTQQTDWVELACQSLRKRFGPEASSEQDIRAKQYRFLAQRGFSADQIRQAMEAYARREE